jgi:hypothetical protein
LVGRCGGGASPTSSGLLRSGIPSAGRAGARPYSDEIIPPEAVEEALDDWDAERFEVYGQVVTLRWLAANEAARVARPGFNDES